MTENRKELHLHKEIKLKKAHTSRCLGGKEIHANVRRRREGEESRMI